MAPLPERGTWADSKQRRSKNAGSVQSHEKVGKRDMKQARLLVTTEDKRSIVGVIG